MLLVPEKEEVEAESFNREKFFSRHIGPRPADIRKMLELLGLSSLDELTKKTVPESILLSEKLSLPKPLKEHELISELKEIAKENTECRSFLGLGYYRTLTPLVIKRNILENPGWYTQYTPYQAEISQGRLEALLNFQTMVTDLTGMELANSSLLDEGTAVAEAVCMLARALRKNKSSVCLVSDTLHPQTLAVLETRAEPLGLKIKVLEASKMADESEALCAVFQYPATDGKVESYSELTQKLKQKDIGVVVAADLLSLTLLEAPGEWGVDAVVGNTQRLGVPMGFGGPHAAYFATKEAYKRDIPGRIVGVSKDKSGNPALRLALQVREQHIKRDRATSNICTAQVLLAIMASMYGVYHGRAGLKQIASRIHCITKALALGLERAGHEILHSSYFDTLRIRPKNLDQVLKKAKSKNYLFREFDDQTIGISLDEATSKEELADVLEVFDAKFSDSLLEQSVSIEPARQTDFLTQEVFNKYHSETEILRYLNRLQSKDLSLTASMIPLGSCTMKLNATAEMESISWPEFAALHPFQPREMSKGYLKIISELENWLAEITGFSGVSLQPNAGSQGEYAGLLVIRAYHEKRGEGQRNICLIPESAHGTNPASAIMAGMKVKGIRCDSAGNISLSDLKAKIAEAGDKLSCLMVTYPSTHGVFEEEIKDFCALIHEAGGQVYLDGANMNAQVGITSPGEIGADVCHLNLHKTFCIPHGGGGPGIGPIGVAKHLVPFLPGHPLDIELGSPDSIGPVAAAPFGSAGILPIPWAYIRMMGEEGLTEATKIAILNANYIAKRLEAHYPILYTGPGGLVAHECILDLREFKKTCGITVEDVAKRLIDYGFHAPTVSWPVPETLMVEPTESESLEELDRFCEAMIQIRKEVSEVQSGVADKDDNVLKNAPHTTLELSSTDWPYSYSREKAAYPVESLKAWKYWAPVKRIDSAYGDRNLVCSCIGMEQFVEE